MDSTKGMTEEQRKALHAQQLEEVKARLAILKSKGYQADALSKDYPVISECTVLEINGHTHVLGTLFTMAEYITLKDARTDALEAVKEFEQTYDAIVYAISAETTEFGTWLDLFHVSAYPEEWERDRAELQDGCPCVYVSSQDDFCSEFGGICYEILEGGIVRTA